jgi:hypothetical protein
MEDAMFTKLYATNIKMDRPNESRKLYAVLSSDFFEESCNQQVDWNEERKVTEFNRIKLLHENFKRLRNTLISVELREGESTLGFGSTILTGLDYNYCVPEREEFKAPETVARIRGASMAGASGSVNTGSISRSSSPNVAPSSKFISPNRVRSMRNTMKGDKIPVMDLRPKNLAQSLSSGDNMHQELKVEDDADQEDSSGDAPARKGFSSKPHPKSTPATPSSRSIASKKHDSPVPPSPSLSSSIEASPMASPGSNSFSTPISISTPPSHPLPPPTATEDLSTQLQTFTFLETDFTVDISYQSTFICTLRGTLRLRFRLGVKH